MTDSRWRKWIRNQFIAFDQALNALLGGDPDETISSRAGKAMDREKPPLWAKVVDWVTHPFEPEHVHKSEEPDEGKDAL